MFVIHVFDSKHLTESKVCSILNTSARPRTRESNATLIEKRKTMQLINKVARNADGIQIMLQVMNITATNDVFQQEITYQTAYFNGSSWKNADGIETFLDEAFTIAANMESKSSKIVNEPPAAPIYNDFRDSYGFGLNKNLDAMIAHDAIFGD